MLSTGSVVIRWIARYNLLTFIRWIVLYLLDNVIHPLNNCARRIDRYWYNITVHALFSR